MMLRPTPWGALLVLRIYVHFFIHLGFPATPQAPAGSEFLDDDISTLTTVLRLSSGESDVLDNHGDYLLFYFRSLITLTHLLVLVLFGPADIRLIEQRQCISCFTKQRVRSVTPKRPCRNMYIVHLSLNWNIYIARQPDIRSSL